MSLHEFHRYGLFRMVRRRPEHDVKLLPVQFHCLSQKNIELRGLQAKIVD